MAGPSWAADITDPAFAGGAKTGDFDNTAAIQAALNANASVWVPPDTFLYNSAIRPVFANSEIFGVARRSTLKKRGSAIDNMIKIENVPGVTIRDLVVDQQSIKGPTIAFVGSTDGRVLGVTGRNSGETAIEFVQDLGSGRSHRGVADLCEWDGVATSPTVNQGGHHFVYGSKADDLRISNSRATGCRQGGVTLAECRRFTVTGNLLNGSQITPGTNYGGIRLVSGNAPTAAGVAVGNVIIGFALGVILHDAVGCLIGNTVIEDTLREGVFGQSHLGGFCHDNEISGVLIRDAGRAAPNSVAGMKLDGTDGSVSHWSINGVSVVNANGGITQGFSETGNTVNNKYTACKINTGTLGITNTA